jgi:MFS family permease
MAIDIANVLPVTQSQVLLIVSIFLAIGALSSLGWAILDIKFSRKKLLYIATLDWTFFTFLTMFATDFFTLLIFQIGSAIGFGAIIPLSYSTIVDLIKAEKRGKAFGIKELFYVLGIGTSFLLASFLVPTFPWTIPLLIISIGGIVCLVLLFFIEIPEREVADKDEAWISMKAFKEIIHSKAVIIILAFNLMLFLWYGAITQYFTTLMRNDYGFIPQMAFLIYLIVTCGQFFSGILFGYLGDRRYEKDKNGRIKIVLLCVTFGAILNFIGFSIILSPENFLTLILFIIIIWTALTLFGGIDPIMQATISDVTTETNRSTTYAINNLCYIFGRSISIFFLSIFLLIFNNLYRPGYMILSIMTLIAVIFLFPLMKVLPREIEKMKAE